MPIATTFMSKMPSSANPRSESSAVIRSACWTGAAGVISMTGARATAVAAAEDASDVSMGFNLTSACLTNRRPAMDCCSDRSSPLPTLTTRDWVPRMLQREFAQQVGGVALIVLVRFTKYECLHYRNGIRRLNHGDVSRFPGSQSYVHRFRPAQDRNVMFGPHSYL